MGICKLQKSTLKQYLFCELNINIISKKKDAFENGSRVCSTGHTLAGIVCRPFTSPFISGDGLSFYGH